MTDQNTLHGQLLDFAPKTADGWGVGTVRAEDGSHAKVTGKLLGVRVGDSVELSGQWLETRYGRQFKVRQAPATVPQTTAGVVAWMASALPEVGERRALAMIARFGVAGLFETIETEPRALCCIDGITAERADAIAIAYEEQRADRDAMIVLRGWGLTDRQVERCLRHWQSAADIVDEVRHNPYVLMDHVSGFGFQRADDVAVRAGIPLDSPMRIAAALHHVLAEQVAAGHCFVPQGKLRVMVERLLGLAEPLIAAAMHDQYAAGRLVTRGQRVYPPRLEVDEADAADKINRLLALAQAGVR